MPFFYEWYALNFIYFSACISYNIISTFQCYKILALLRHLFILFDVILLLFITNFNIFDYKMYRSLLKDYYLSYTYLPSWIPRLHPPFDDARLCVRHTHTQTYIFQVYSRLWKKKLSSSLLLYVSILCSYIRFIYIQCGWSPSNVIGHN